MTDAHLPDNVLLALAEEAASEPDARAHLSACRGCRAQVDAYRAAAAAVRCAQVPARAWCPPREGLLAFAADLGEAPPSPALRAHVAACPACRDDVRDLLALEVEPAPLLETLRARVTLLVEQLGETLGRGLRLLESTLTPAPLPAPALARGAAPARSDAVAVVAPLPRGELEVTWVAAADGIDLRARARGDAPRTYRLDLSTPAPASEPASAEVAAPTPATWRLLESRSADEAGDVTLAGLTPGRYLLTVFGPQRSEPDLTLELELRA